MVVEKNVAQELSAIDQRITALKNEIIHLKGARQVLASISTPTVSVSVPDEIKATKVDPE